MKLSSLLVKRQALLEQSRLANLAFAFDRLSDFARRIARARLVGEVRLQPASPEAQRYWPTLTALEGNQSVIEEHFTEEDLANLYDVLAFVAGENERDFTFRIEDLRSRFIVQVHEQLTQAGVDIDWVDQTEDASHGNIPDHPKRGDELQ